MYVAVHCKSLILNLEVLVPTSNLLFLEHDRTHNSFLTFLRFVCNLRSLLMAVFKANRSSLSMINFISQYQGLSNGKGDFL